MALSFPLARAAFLDRLPIRDVTFTLSRSLQSTGLSGGEILSAEVAPAYWQGNVSLAPMASRRAAEVAALLEALEVPGRAFEAHHPHQLGPASDPAGAGLSVASPAISGLDGADAQVIDLDGLPEGYELSPGDRLSFAYDPGSGPRCALHRIVTGGVADGLGVVAGLSVVPAIRPGASLGAAVDLLRPFCLAQLVPGSVRYGITRGSTCAEMGFRFRQVLRG